MSSKNVESLEIHAGEGGGDRIVHNYKRQPTKGTRGDIYMGGGERKEHNFGPGQEQQVLSHISKALGCKKGPNAESGIAEEKEATDPKEGQLDEHSLNNYTF